MALIDNMEDITEEQIALDGLNALDNKYQKSVGFFAWDYFVALGKIFYKLWERVIYIAKCLTDLSYMDYSDLVNFVFQTRGIIAKTSTKASGLLTVTNGTGTIKQGDTFSTASGIEFRATQTVEVSQNSTFNVECLENGSIGNVEANSIVIIPTTIQGIVSVTNNQSFTNGYDDETKEELLERYYDDIQKPIASGNIYHYMKWAKEVTGVGDAKIKPLWDGDNTVKIVILNSNKEIPSADLIQSVQNYIDPYTLVEGVKVGWGCGNGQAPIGAYCTVVGATAKNLNISISNLTIKSGQNISDVKDNIENSVKSYLKSVAFDDNISYISYAKIGAIIMDSDGVLDYDSFSLNNANNNVLLTDNNSITEVAVLNNLTI